MLVVNRMSGVLVAALLGSALFLSAEEAAAPSREKIESLVKDLASEKSEVRDRATKELEAAGAPAVPSLKEAARSDDPEVAWRARTILDHIDGERAAGKAPAMPDPGSGARLHSFNFRINPGTGGSSVVITRDGSGRVSLKVTEQEDGKPVTKNYEAESTEDFKKKYPDVAKKYGIGEEGSAPRVLREFMPRMGKGWLDDDFFSMEWPSDLGKEMEEMRERMRMQVDEAFRRHGLDPRNGRVPRLRDRGGDEDAPPARNRDEAEGRAPAPGDGPAAASAAPSTPATLGVGVAEVEPALRAQLQLGESEGVLIDEVQDNGPARKAGLQRHDVIVSVNGTKVKGVWELRRVLREAAEADRDRTLEIGIIRGGARQTIPVKLGDK